MLAGVVATAPGAMPIPAAMPTELSVEAWFALDEDVEGELVDGQLVEEEAASWAHELVVSWLIRILGAWIVPRGGFVLGSETKLVVSARRGRKPDVLLCLAGSARKGRSAPARIAAGSRCALGGGRPGGGGPGGAGT